MSEKSSVPISGSWAVVGLNSTVAVQLLPKGSEVPQVVPCRMKSAVLVTALAGNATVVSPVLVMVTVAQRSRR